METTLSHPPLAKPQQISTPRRVGLVMTYNQRESCIEAINSLLAQTLALDLIIVSDDCSTDGTYEVIADHFSKKGKPSNVVLYQSEKNLGFIPHFNALLKNHCGDDDLIFYNAGDDISETSRVEEFYREYVTKGKPRHFLGHSYVTSFGSGTEEILVPPIESIKDNRELCLIASAYHIGASQVFTGALFFDFGPILFDDCYEDLTLGYRALLKDAYHFIPKALLRYRAGGLSSWQKNPLEKKRGRLKSTLTQRAVDSMRSGDYEALTTIQDCYSQYGFSHKPHAQRIKVTVISDLPPEITSHRYTVSDHFRTLSNICDPQWSSSETFLNQLATQENLGQHTLIWIATQRLPQTALKKIFAALDRTTSLNIVIDTGLHTHTNSTDIEKEPLFKGCVQFLKQLTFGHVHCSCKLFAETLMTYTMINRITYLQPLQYIDGPDRKFVPSNTFGIVAVCDLSNETLKALNMIRKMQFSSNALGLCLDVSLLGPDCQKKLADLYPSLPLWPDHDAPISLECCSHLIVLTNHSETTHDSVRYWWTVGAKNCLPIFLNSTPVSTSYLVHGVTCLFIDSQDATWTKANQLIKTNYQALVPIASEARRRAYFKDSIQKNTSAVLQVLKNVSRAPCNFDKFLPL